MARRLVPEQVRAAITAHARLAHRLDRVEEDEIGRTGSRRASVSFTWEPGDERGARFLCRLCEEGWGRYYVEVEAGAPSEALLARIRAHFADRHGIPELDSGEIFSAENPVRKAKATFLPLTPALGAGFVCALCPAGMNRVFVTPPPHGDARRLRLLLQRDPALWRRIGTRTSREQAEYLEAHDFGLLDETPRDVSRALRDARRRSVAAEQNPLDAALARILLRRVQQGERITHAIRELATLARQNAVAFACAVGSELPAWNQSESDDGAQERARRVAAFLLLPEGVYPSVSERKLWEVWRVSRSSA